jgi:large subunit ribosomal protein L24
MKLKVGDNVIVLTGKDNGKKGKILKIDRESNRVVIEGVNMAKKHQKGQQKGKGQIIEVPASINASNVALIDPKTKKATRLGSKIVKDKRVRVAIKSGQEV